MTSSASADTERDLLQRVALRDDAALAALYERFASTVYGVAHSILRDQTDAEEVVQETFVYLWTRARDYVPERGTPGAWVVMLARSRAIDLLRSRRHKARGLMAPEEARLLAEPPASPLELAQQTRAWSEVSTELSRLPLEQRRAIELAFYGGLSHSEIAARTGEPLGTVKTRIRRGLERLARRIERPAEE